ncbi:fungal-specific transcription factor domain-containing protein [Phaeosphaeriaceae sp. PMI808]|nr:fungal-specific transcription factor domain-containing protein [Phaeosphaeriaceae sp. PMI808]
MQQMQKPWRYISPTLSYTQRLEEKVKQLEAALSEIKGSPSDSQQNDVQGSQTQSPGSEMQNLSPKTDDDPRLEDDERLSLNESISLFQLPGSIRTLAAKESLIDPELAAKKESLVNSAWRERAYEQMADTPEPFRSLLDSHFCWIQPLFNFVYRPAFTRDMQNGGPYFSKALLNAILSHSLRWCRGEPGMDQLLAPFDDGAAFAKEAVKHVFEDVQHGSSRIPTVQALLLLSAQECGRGNRTQAWLYSGMAFRLIDDMGICVDGKRYENAGELSAEETEIRNRLFWSCYFWDKLISLYFGRSPLIQNSEISPPRIVMDDTAELEAWTPHGVLVTYPPQPAHSISCFIQMCGLAEILNQILIHLYNPSQAFSPSLAHQYALAESSKLRDWWRDLPVHLKIDLAAVPLDCPPSHVVTLNCLYHTINILLNRAKLKLSREPELATSIAEHNPLIQCISSATSIIALFDLYSRTFGEGHVVLSLAYSVYMAASIFLLEVQAVGHAAPSTLQRLHLCVRTLDRLRHTSPVIGTAFGLISKELAVLGIQLPDSISHTPRNLSSQRLPPQPLLPMPVDFCPLPSVPEMPLSDPVDRYEETVLLDQFYLNSQGEGSMSYNLLDMPHEMYETFSHIEPISVVMDPGFNIY